MLTNVYHSVSSHIREGARVYVRERSEPWGPELWASLVPPGPKARLVGVGTVRGMRHAHGCGLMYALDVELDITAIRICS